jgi:hypothetical protein
LGQGRYGVHGPPRSLGSSKSPEKLSSSFRRARWDGRASFGDGIFDMGGRYVQQPASCSLGKFVVFLPSSRAGTLRWTSELILMALGLARFQASGCATCVGILMKNRTPSLAQLGMRLGPTKYCFKPFRAWRIRVGEVGKASLHYSEGRLALERACANLCLFCPIAHGIFPPRSNSHSLLTSSGARIYLGSWRQGGNAASSCGGGSKSMACLDSLLARIPVSIAGVLSGLAVFNVMGWHGNGKVGNLNLSCLAR